MEEVPLFKFSGPDGLTMLSGWIWLAIFLVPLFIGLPLVAFATVLAGGAVFVLGLRSAIVVRPGKVSITKKWFFIPYRCYEAEKIDDVWYSGDWGLDDGAIGVVVQLGKKEIHIGSRSTMHGLFDALFPLTENYKTNFQHLPTKWSINKKNR